VVMVEVHLQGRGGRLGGIPTKQGFCHIGVGICRRSVVRRVSSSLVRLEICVERCARLHL
jgi:hypothetical protein